MKETTPDGPVDPDSATLPRAPLRDIPRGTLFGRYVILERLGAGGMGVVYKAFDPDLDRRVALKVVRIDARDSQVSPTEGRERLLREAQAMAKLSHPNVIPVFDVGTVESDVFVAMELVDGPSLRAWLPGHGVHEIVPVFVQAGRGLQAAHDAGLVHRDFKPDNVLVGRDGRVRVLDFGLARALTAGLDGEDEWPTLTAPSSDRLAARLTETGSIVGTPAYMSPEQHLGIASDARGDQFSFCVALWEALHGELPFAGASYKEYAANVVAGRLREGRFLKRQLARGLCVRAEERWPSMDALLGSLQARRKSWPLWAAGGAALAAAAAVALFSTRSEDPCAHVADGLAAVWGGERRGAVAAAFQATNAVYAGDAWNRVGGILDDYARDWASMRRDSCTATRVRGVQSDELMDMRMLCLDNRLQALRALGDVLATADANLVAGAPMAARGLPPLAECADVAAITARVRQPADPALRARIAVVEAHMADVVAMRLTGRIKEGLDAAARTALEASLVPFRPLQAQTVYWLADLQSLAGDSKLAEKTLRHALALAQAARDLRAQAKIYTELIGVAGRELDDAERAMEYARSARGVIESVGGDLLLEGRVAGYEGQILQAQGREAEALAAYQLALAKLVKAVGPEDIDVATTLNDIGGLYRQMHDNARAREYLQRALDIRERYVGPNHPWVASSILNLGNVFHSEGNYAEALAHYERSLAIREKSLGPDHRRVAESLVQMGDCYDRLGRGAEARAALERALAIQEKVFGPDHQEVARVLHNLGNVERTAGDLDAAVASFERSLKIKIAKLGPEHESVAMTTYSLGEVYRDQGKLDAALAAFERALVLDTKASGEDSVDLAYDLTGIGTIHVMRGKPAVALAPLERALALRTKYPGDPVELAGTQFQLAKALWGSGGDRKCALSLANSARAALAAGGAGAKKELTAVDSWLAAARP